MMRVASGARMTSLTFQSAKTVPAGSKNQPVVVSIRVKVASALIAIFCVLNAADAYTTEVGLSDGAREINTFSAYFIATFGIQGYVIAKVVASLAIGLVAIVVWRSWHRMNPVIFDFYLGVSLSFAAIGGAAVLNNLIILALL